MSVVIGTHEQCNGTGEVPNPGYPGTHRCAYCEGSGVRKRRGYGGYKTAAGAAKALREKTGLRCSMCNATGQIPFPATNPCPCRHGQVVIEAHVGDVLPELIDITSSIPREVAASLAAELEVALIVEDRPGSWMEAHLGIGTVVSCTDYGDSFDLLRTDPVVGQERMFIRARDEIARGTQWCKLARRDTREIVDRVVVTVHRNGWNLITVATLESSLNQVASLPPTYTPEVLNRPVSR